MPDHVKEESMPNHAAESSQDRARAFNENNSVSIFGPFSVFHLFIFLRDFVLFCSLSFSLFLVCAIISLLQV